jgi:hypothetical protein
MMLQPEPIWMSCYFFSKKKPHKFNLRLTTMCVTNGYTEVLEWWKETEIVELFGIAVQSPQRMVRMLDCLYEIGYQQAASYVKDALEILIVHWAASGGMIDVATRVGSGLRHAW